MRYRGMLVLALVALQGCAMNGAPSAGWTAASQGGGTCATLQGTYSNQGEAPDPKLRQVSLAGLLRFKDPGAEKADRMRLTVGADGAALFEPIAQPDDPGSDFKRAPKLVLTCRDGVLSWSGSIRDLRSDNIGDALVGPDRISFELRRGTDRALYVRTWESGAGLAYMFLPVAFSGREYFRFAAAD